MTVPPPPGGGVDTGGGGGGKPSETTDKCSRLFGASSAVLSVTPYVDGISIAAGKPAANRCQTFLVFDVDGSAPATRWEVERQIVVGGHKPNQEGIRGRFRTARAQRVHSANYYGDYPGNNPENHPPAESCTINSKLKNSNI